MDPSVQRIHIHKYIKTFSIKCECTAITTTITISMLSFALSLVLCVCRSIAFSLPAINAHNLNRPKHPNIYIQMYMCRNIQKQQPQWYIVSGPKKKQQFGSTATNSCWCCTLERVMLVQNRGIRMENARVLGESLILLQVNLFAAHFTSWAGLIKPNSTPDLSSAAE